MEWEGGDALTRKHSYTGQLRWKGWRIPSAVRGVPAAAAGCRKKTESAQVQRDATSIIVGASVNRPPCGPIRRRYQMREPHCTAPPHSSAWIGGGDGTRCHRALGAFPAAFVLWTCLLGNVQSHGPIVVFLEVSSGGAHSETVLSAPEELTLTDRRPDSERQDQFGSEHLQMTPPRRPQSGRAIKHFPKDRSRARRRLETRLRRDRRKLGAA